MTTLIIPGWYGSGDGHWQSWWLRSQPDARLVVQKDWEQPTLEGWLANLVRAVEAAAPPPILVAHSLGAILVAQLAVRHPQLAIGGALLVAPADVDDPSWTPAQIAGFGPVPLRRLPFPALVVASRNDPFVGFDRAGTFASAWGARLVDLGQAGHINDQTGFGPWPAGLRLARSLRPLRPAVASAPPWVFAGRPLTGRRRAQAG
jgi:predicted alpha/beta hydrolase family esterase